jgi:hypothetical protein
MAVGLLIAGIALLPTFVGGIAATRGASAAEAKVDLGTATPFSVLAGAAVTNTGDTVLGGDLGTSPTPAITGFPPGVAKGTTHAADAVADQAQRDLTTAYNSAAGRAATTTYTEPTDLGGLTLTTGVYKSPDSFAITGALTLNAQGNPNAVFIFQAASTLITATDSSVRLINGAQACNVFWQVGSSATLGTDSTLVGTVMALTSITAGDRATVDGRLLASNGAVTLHDNQVSAAACTTGGTSPDGGSSGGGSSGGDSTPPSGSDGGSSGGGSSGGDSTPPSGSDGGSSGGGSSGGDSSSPSGSSGGSSEEGSSPASGSEQGSSSTTGTSASRSGSASTGGTTPSGSPTATNVLGGSVNGTGLNGSAPAGTLPRTGSSIAIAVMLAIVALLLGAGAMRFGRARHG